MIDYNFVMNIANRQYKQLKQEKYSYINPELLPNIELDISKSFSNCN